MSFVTKIKPWHWRTIRHAIQYVRHEWFSVTYDERQLEVEIPLEDVKSTLGNAGFARWEKFAYNYRGEDLGMRMPVYRDDEYEWYQLHVRAFVEDGVVRFAVHVELDPLVHPEDHLDGVNLSVDEGTEMLMDVLDEAGVSYTDIRNQNS